MFFGFLLAVVAGAGDSDVSLGRALGGVGVCAKEDLGEALWPKEGAVPNDEVVPNEGVAPNEDVEPNGDEVPEVGGVVWAVAPGCALVD